jgi:small subunit ribosomal protein S4e
MARGPIKHLKRINAPKHWMLGKLGGTWAPRPSTGPHRLRECLPVSLILRNRLKYALTRRETQTIVMRRHVQIDGQVRTDINYPAGFMDVVSLPASKEHFRLLYDVKGRFSLVHIHQDEAAYKLIRIKAVNKSKKGTSGKNPFLNGQAGVVPVAVGHDSRTIRFADPNWKVNDVVKYNLRTGKVEEHFRFQVGALVMLNGGGNVGRVGVITNFEKHPGSFDIVHIKDKRGHKFATRVSNVFVIGADANSPAVTLPKLRGVKRSILEEAKERKN